MRSLAEAWPEEAILQQLIAKLPWGHNLRVLDRIKDRPTREWSLLLPRTVSVSQKLCACSVTGPQKERNWGCHYNELEGFHNADRDHLHSSGPAGGTGL